MNTPHYKILLVEDNIEQAALMEKFLSMVESVSLEIVWVDQLSDAFSQVQNNHFDLVLLDLMLPDSRGLDTYKRFLARFPQTPVVVTTAVRSEKIGIEAVQMGAQDYLIKGDINHKTMVRAIVYALVRNEKDENLRKLALIDDLSQLYNRRGFTSVCQQCQKQASRDGNHLLLIMVDVDGLKVVNDTYGHPEGDRAIADTAQILKDTFRGSDLIGRIGGDEFAVLAVQSSGDSGKGIRERLQVRIDKYNRTNRNFLLSLSLGITSFDPKEEIPLEALLIQADKDLYIHKKYKREKDSNSE
jgi:two-component system cell cycle response regulator